MAESKDVSTSHEGVVMEGTGKMDMEIVKLRAIIEIILGEVPPSELITMRKELTERIIDIDLSDELSGILMTVFTCLRKEENDNAGHVKYLAYKAKIKGGEISITNIVDKVKKEKIQMDFLVATPIVEIMTLFKAYFDEVRTGVTRFRVRASVANKAQKRTADGRTLPGEKSRKNTQNISQYGLCSRHIPLLHGLTLAPERRTGVVRSLGTLTQAILLVNEDKYHPELSSALLDSINMLPMAGEVIYCLKHATSPGEVMGILNELGDILLMTTARPTQNIFMPLTMFMLLWDQKESVHGLQWSFSGASMLKYYNLQVENGMRLKLRTGGDTIKTQEVVFHAMFGTYLEDLSILSKITTHGARWHQRKELNEVFIIRSENPAKILEPIKFTYIYHQKISPKITKSLGNIDACGTSRPSFSGFRKRSFTQEFLNYLSKGRSGHSYSTDPIHQRFALKKTKDTLLHDKDSVKMIQAGAITWETMINGQWQKCEFVPTEGNYKFYGF